MISKIFLPYQMKQVICDKAQLVYEQKKPGHKLSMNRVYKVIDRLIERYQKQQISFDEPVQISKKWFRKVSGGRYNEVVNTLLNLGVLKRVKKGLPAYNGMPGFASLFKFNIELFDGPPCIVEYKTHKRKTPSPEYIESKAIESLQRVSWEDGKRKFWLVNEDTTSTNTYCRDHAREAQNFINDYANDIDLLGAIEGATMVNDSIQLPGNKKIKIFDVSDNIDLPINKKTGKYKQVTFEYALIVARKHNVDLIQYTKKGIQKYYLKNYADFINGKYAAITFSWSTRIDEIKSLSEVKPDQVRVSRNNTNRRLETAAANLKSEFVPYLRIDGEPLSQPDLQCSQLTILANVTITAIEGQEHIIKTYMFEPETLQDIQMSLFTIDKIYLPITINLYREYLMYIKEDSSTKLGHKTRKAKNQRVKANLLKIAGIVENWYKDVTTGDCYRNLAAMMHNKPLNAVTDQERKTAKVAYFRVLFDSWVYPFPEKEIIRKAYPGLIEIFDGFKKYIFEKRKKLKERYPARYEKAYGKKTPYQLAKAALPCMLQLIESKIFIDGIFYECCKKGIPVLGRHDSILCKESDFITVDKIMRKHLSGALYGYQIK